MPQVSKTNKEQDDDKEEKLSDLLEPRIYSDYLFVYTIHAFLYPSFCIYLLRPTVYEILILEIVMNKTVQVAASQCLQSPEERGGRH